MQRRKWTVLIVSVLLWSVAVGLAVAAQPRRAPHAALTLVRVQPVGEEVHMVLRVPDGLDLNCPMQLRIGDLSLTFRDVQDANARTARFVLSRELYRAIDNRRHETVLTSCHGWVAQTITYPRLSEVRPPPRASGHAALTLVRVQPVGEEVHLVLRVPDGLDLNCPMQLRIGDLSLTFRDVQDANARTARFVLSRELYRAIDNRRHETVLTSCHGWVAQTITYPPLRRTRS